MEVVDVVADYFGLIDDKDVRAGVMLLAEEVCAAYPSLRCSHMEPSRIRDIGFPYYVVNDKSVMIRNRYSPMHIADCFSSVSKLGFEGFTIVHATFTTIFDSQSIYLNNLQLCGFKPSVVLDCGAHVGDWTNKVKRHRFPDATVLMVCGYIYIYVIF